MNLNLNLNFNGTSQIDKTFIKGLLTIQDQEPFKIHNKRKLRQQYRKSRFYSDKTAPSTVSFHHAWAANTAATRLRMRQVEHFRSLFQSHFPVRSSWETQGQIVGARESLNGRKNKARRKVKNGQKSTWGQCLTRPVPNGRRRSGFWLVPEKHKFWFVFLHRKNINKY